MNNEQGDNKEYDPTLIEDVVPQDAEPVINVNREEVKYQTIGGLHHLYLRSRAKKAAAKGPSSNVPRNIDAVRPLSQVSYTRTPPLQTLPSFYPETSTTNSAAVLFGGLWEFMNSSFYKLTELLALAAQHTERWIMAGFTRLNRFFTAIGVGLVDAVRHPIRSMWLWLPKRYTLTSGLVINWRARLFSRLKIAAPTILVLALLVVVIATGTLTSPGYLKGKKAHSPVQKPVTSSSLSSAHTSGITSPAPATGTAPSIPVSGGSNAATSAGSGSSPTPATLPTTSNLTGGLGSGPVPSPATSPTPIPTPTTSPSPSGGVLPINTTLTIPPTNVQAGGKTLLQDSGTSVTAN